MYFIWVTLVTCATFLILYYRFKDANKVNWNGEVVVVSGGSSGIGAALVDQLHRRGAIVAILDLHHPAQELKDGIHFFKTDVTDPKSVMDSADAVQKRLGSAFVLINNAGVTRAGPNILDADTDREALTLNTNLMSHFFTIKAFAPTMVKHNKGHILSMASASAFVPLPGSLDYSVAKAGLIALRDGLELEFAYTHHAPDIQLSIAFPSFVNTPLIAGVFADESKLLTVDKVASAIMGQLDTGKGGEIYIPSAVRLLPWLSAFLPRNVLYLIRLHLLHRMAKRRT